MTTNELFNTISKDFDKANAQVLLLLELLGELHRSNYTAEQIEQRLETKKNELMAQQDKLLELMKVISNG